MGKIDEMDLTILNAMRNAGSITTNATYIAKLIGKPTATVHSRLKRMERDRIITSYIPVIDYQKSGLEVNGYVLLKVRTGTQISGLIGNLTRLDEVKEAHTVMGEWKILLNIKTKTMDKYAAFMQRLFEEFPDITEIRDMVASKTYKKTF